MCVVCRRVWPQYVQKSLYVFLKYNFEYWPLDSMFRMVQLHYCVCMSLPLPRPVGHGHSFCCLLTVEQDNLFTYLLSTVVDGHFSRSITSSSAS